MPFKSEAQRRKFGALVSQGKITKEKFKEWNDATPAKIPKRVGEKPKHTSIESVVAYRKKKYGV